MIKNLILMGPDDIVCEIILRIIKHILVEKPMAKTQKEITEISNLSKEKKLIAMVGHTFLYNSAVKEIKDIVKEFKIVD